MIDHVWTIACSRAVIDNRTNNVTVQNIIEQLKIHDNPKPDGMLNIPFDVITHWERSEIDTPVIGHGRLSFVFPSGKTNIAQEYEIGLLDTIGYRSIGHLEQLPVRESGRHFFRVELKIGDENEWIEVAKTPIMIVFEPPEVEEEETNPEENIKPMETK